MRNTRHFHHPSQLLFLASLAWTLFLGQALFSIHGATPPNFVFFIVDDVSQEDLGCYGSTCAKTPNLDRMAADGMRFDQAYLTISSCSPSRCSIITGRYPHNTGAPELHTTLPKDQVTFIQELRKAGYYTVISGKNHMGKAGDLGFEKESKGKGPGKEEDWVSLLANRPKDRPFFCWFASTDAHRGWNLDDNAPTYDPADIEVPPYLFDGPKTREDLAAYFHEVSRTDTFAGRLRDELRRQGVEGDTYVIYMADNGRPFPRCKTRVYDSGVRTPFIVTCPGRIQPGISQSLISSIDVSATVLDLAGLAKPPSIQGVSFRSILEDPKAKTRDYVFAEHNWHVFQAHERMVRFGDWMYIRNAFPNHQALCMESDATYPAGEELWAMEAAGKLDPKTQRDIFLNPRPAEELFQVSRDPHQLVNLADRSEHTEILKSLRSALDQWTRETGDTVPQDPTNDRQDAQGRKLPNHHRGTLPGTEKGAPKIHHPGPVRAVGSL